MLLASLLLSGAAFAQTSPLVMVTPSDYNIMAASPNGKWACGMYFDSGNEAYGFRWNLESGEIDLLNPSSPSQAYSVSNNGVVVGLYTDNGYKKNGASTQLAGYWQNNRWNRLEMPSDAVSSSGASGISPDGHYITGNVYVGGKYLGYVWKDGKIYRQLKENNGIAIPYAISPDGEYTTGWVMNKNRQACFWGPDGNFTTLSDQQSPFCVGKKFSPDGKKLLYFGGWQTEEEAGGAGKVRGAWALYDMETGKKSAILPAGDNDDLDFFDISGNFNPDNANLETFGLSFDGESYETAIVFDAVTLSAYKGQKLTSVGFYPMEAQGGWTINLYTRSTDGKLQKFYTQPVTQRQNYGERNVVKLDTPQNLPSGELLVSVEVKVTEASQRITALDFGRAVKGSSDLLRLTTEPDFYSMGNLMEESNYLYAASWAIDAIVAPEGADLAKDNVTGYNIYVDGKKVGSFATKSFTVPSLDKGDHALGVRAVYANGSESEQAVAQLAVVPDDSQLQAVKGVAVAPVSASAVKADWAAPVDRDVVQVQYCTGSASTQGVTAPADNNYNIMVGALYPSKTFRGRTGYAIKKARFYPLTDATYTVDVYKNDELISETEVDDYTVGKWNEVELTMPIIIENGSTYRLAIDCYDVTPKEPAIAVDSSDPLEGYSDINSLDGESWSSISSTGVMANWMIGLVLENPKPGTLPIEGYDVFIDNAKKNAAKLTERTYTHDFGTDDKQQHTIRVDVYYTVKSTSVKGGVTNFLIAVAGIDENTIGLIEMRQGENELTVTDEGVTSVELVSAAGAVVAKAEGNIVSLNGLTAGVCVVKAVVAGETITRKIMITK